jgi:CHAT domain-containing protein/Tfp pilus assembly protein PilF
VLALASVLLYVVIGHVAAQQPPPKPTAGVQTLLDAALRAPRNNKLDVLVGMYDQALSKARELKDRKGEVEALRGRGTAYLDNGDQQKARESYEESLAIAKAIQDLSGQGSALSNLARIHILTGQRNLAIENWKQALTNFRTIGDKVREAVILRNMGIFYGASGMSQLSIEFSEQALAIDVATNNKLGEAAARKTIGIGYGRIGQPQKALEYLERSLAISKEIKDRRGEAHANVSLGWAYGETWQYDKAMDFFKQALAVYQDLGDKVGMGASRGGIATCYNWQGKPQQALAEHEHALALYEAAGDKLKAGAVRGNIARCYIYLKQWDKSIEFSQLALRAFEAAGDKHGISNTLYNMGSVEVKRNRLKEAVDYYLQALPAAKEADDHAYEARVLNELGKVERAQGKFAKAEEHFASAVALIEIIRENYGGYTESKSSFLTDRITYYNDYLQALVKAGKADKAFEIAQKTKGRSLLDLLYAGRVDLSSGLTPDEQKEEESLRSESDTLNRALVAEGVENEVGSKMRSAQIKEQIKELEKRLGTLTETLYRRHPELVYKRTASTATTQNMARALPADTALLEYVALSSNTLQLFIITSSNGKAHVESIAVPINYTRLARMASEFHAACADPRKDYRPIANNLHALLIGRALPHLKSVKRLVICPDGALWDVPFQALPLASSGKQFLADQYEIAYAYSATGAQAALTLAAKRKASPAGSILVAANPAFGSSDRFGDLKEIPGQRPIESASRPIESASRPIESASRPIESASRPIESASRPIESASRPIDVPSRAFESASRAFESASRAIESASRGKAIRSLPGTQREADVLKKLFPNAMVLTGDKAQEGVFKEKAGSYRYLHLATHGFVNDSSPLLSSVILAKPSSETMEDGFLTAREIYGLNLNAEMTVLSACNTARGENRTGEGVVGLTWALFVAGCPTQVVSQWAVDDKSTALLMSRFYENLKVRSMAKAASLKEAEVWLQKQNAKYRHPYYWAPFVLNGAWK